MKLIGRIQDGSGENPDKFGVDPGQWADPGIIHIFTFFNIVREGI